MVENQTSEAMTSINLISIIVLLNSQFVSEDNEVFVLYSNPDIHNIKQKGVHYRQEPTNIKVHSTLLTKTVNNKK